jgi:hypothetical protein
MGKNIALFIDGTGNNGPRDEPSDTALLPAETLNVVQKALAISKK